MQNYESPTIEGTGGPGNELEPQVVAIVLILLVRIVLSAYLTFAAYTTVAESVVAVHAAGFYKTLALSILLMEVKNV